MSTHQPPPLPEDNLQHPCSIGNPNAQQKLGLMFHDETVFNANRTIKLDREWTHEVETEGPEHGIMISNFTDKHDGFLKWSDEDFDWYYQKDPLLKESAPKQFVIGHGNESYRMNDHFLNSAQDIMTIYHCFRFRLEQ